MYRQALSKNDQQLLLGLQIRAIWAFKKVPENKLIHALNVQEKKMIQRRIQRGEDGKVIQLFK